MDPHKAGRANYKEPTNRTELLSFPGIVQFFSDHIQNGADRVAPLCDILPGTGWIKKKPKNLKIQIPGWDIKWG